MSYESDRARAYAQANQRRTTAKRTRIILNGINQIQQDAYGKIPSQFKEAHKPYDPETGAVSSDFDLFECLKLLGENLDSMPAAKEVPIHMGPPNHILCSAPLLESQIEGGSKNRIDPDWIDYCTRYGYCRSSDYRISSDIVPKPADWEGEVRVVTHQSHILYVDGHVVTANPGDIVYKSRTWYLLKTRWLLDRLAPYGFGADDLVEINQRMPKRTKWEWLDHESHWWWWPSHTLQWLSPGCRQPRRGWKRCIRELNSVWVPFSKYMRPSLRNSVGCINYETEDIWRTCVKKMFYLTEPLCYDAGVVALLSQLPPDQVARYPDDTLQASRWGRESENGQALWEALSQPSCPIVIDGMPDNM